MFLEFLYRGSKGLLAPFLLSALLLLMPGAEAPASGSVPRIANQDAESLKAVAAPFKFAVVGDNRSGGGVYGGLAKSIAQRNPALVVNVGDVVKDAGDKGEWADFVKLSEPITAPYFIVPGNHDIDSAKTEALFKKWVDQPGNELYYSFTAGNALFVMLNTEEPGKESKVAGEQFKWLEEILKASGERFKFVFLHRPLYPGKDGLRLTSCLSRHRDSRDRLQALFEKYNVDVVFAGHEHMYKRQYFCGVTHIITGGGGAPLYVSEKKGGFYHYITVAVGADSARLKVVDPDGRTRDEFSITKGHA